METIAVILACINAIIILPFSANGSVAETQPAFSPVLEPVSHTVLAELEPGVQFFALSLGGRQFGLIGTHKGEVVSILLMDQYGGKTVSYKKQTHGFMDDISFTHLAPPYDGDEYTEYLVDQDGDGIPDVKMERDPPAVYDLADIQWKKRERSARNSERPTTRPSFITKD